MIKSLCGLLLSGTTAAWISGCAGSSQGSRVDELAQKVADQETRLTRLNQTVSASESRLDYIQTQVEHAAPGSTASARRTEVAKSAVHFARNEYELTGDAKNTVDQLAQNLAGDPFSVIEIRGFTDGLGTPEYNYQLGERRAETVARYLNTKHGIPLYRMERISFGKDEAVTAGRNDLDDPASRRVEMRVLSGGSASGSPNVP